MKNIKEIIRNNGGLTLNKKGEKIKENNGFMVSLLGYERKLKFDDLTDANILTLVNTYKGFSKGKKGAYIGLWLDNGYLYIDISIKIKNKAQAMTLAKDNKQIAIYNLSNGESEKVIYNTIYSIYKVIKDIEGNIIDLIYIKDIKNTSNYKFNVYESKEDEKGNEIDIIKDIKENDNIIIIKDNLYMESMEG